MGARMAVRPESRANSTFGATDGDERWRVLQAARIDAAGRFGPLGVVVQLQDVRAWGQSLDTASNDAFTGVHQGYVEIAGSFGHRVEAQGYIRAGRQEVRVWTGRLLAESPWAIGRRAFDGLRGRVDVERFGAEIGVVVTRTPRTITDMSSADTSVQSQGDQIAWTELTARVHRAFEPHLGMWLRHQGATETNVERNILHITPAAYVHGEPIDGLVYDVEGYGQFGRNTNVDHRAWAGAAAVAYTTSLKLKPGLRLSYEVASGSECSAAPNPDAGCNESVERDFDGFHGVRHGYRGFADQIGVSNFRDLHGRASMQPSKEISFWLDYHWFSLHEARGQWTSTSGALVGRGFDPTNNRNTLGHEVDVLVNYRPFEGALEVRPGYSVFVPTAAGRDLAGGDAQHFAYVWIVAQLGHRWSL